MLEQYDAELLESFINQTNLPIRILDAEKKFKQESQSIITTRKEYMHVLYKLSEKINSIMGTLSFMKDSIKGREEEWEKLMAELHLQRKKLKESEIIADRNAPRGKVIVEDEEGFVIPPPYVTPAPPTRTSTKSSFLQSLEELTGDNLSDDETSLARYDNLDALDLDETGELKSSATESFSLEDLLKDMDEPLEDGKNVMSAIDAILDGNYDSIVMDKSKLQGLTLDDILG